MSALNKIRQNRRANLNSLIDLYTRVGVSNRTGISPAYLFQMTTDGKNKRGINDDNAKLIEQAFGKPDGWLDKDHSEQRKGFDSNVELVETPTRRIPLISYVQAAAWTKTGDCFDMAAAADWILTTVETSNSAFALKISGESMLPDFKEGDIVIVDPFITPQPGDYVVAKATDKDATFKKYRPRGNNEAGELVFELVPLNQDFPTLRSDIDRCEIIGVMVEHRQFRKPQNLMHWMLAQAETNSPPRNEKEQAAVDMLRQMLSGKK